MLLLYDDPRFELYQTGPHPENPGRLQAIRERLGDLSALPGWQRTVAPAASREQLGLVHSADYLDRLAATAGKSGRLDADTAFSPHSWEVATLAAGACCDAVRQVCDGTAERAACLVRPPGHHALGDRAMGFCLLANVSIAARYAQQVCGLSRVLIVDWDVHHGNGTQDIFYDDGSVTFFSMHRFPFYPGTGAEDETGTGKGLGHTVNVPVKFGTTSFLIHERFERGLELAVERSRPELILISAGFDAHSRDPIGSLGLSSSSFNDFTTSVVDAARHWCGGRIVSVLEGGYDPHALAECVEGHLKCLTPES